MIKKVLQLLSDRKGLFRMVKGTFFLLKFIFPAIKRLLRCRNKLCICFDYNNGIYAEFYLNIYLNLKEIDKFEVVLLANPLSPQWNYDRRFTFKDFIPVLFYKYLKKRIVIHATSLKPRYLAPEEKTKHVQMNHGFGSFVSVLDESYINNVDMFFANTEHQVKQLKGGVYDNNIDSKFIKRIGYPKIDSCISENACNLKKKEVESIFYGPTYHVEISSIFSFLDPLIQFCAHNSIKLYIKLHPFLLRKFEYDKSGGIDWKKRVQKYSKVYSNIEFVSTFQLFPEVVKYFKKSDVFMTDNSGFGYEYVLITGKPIVFLGNKLKIPVGDLSQNSEKIYNECPEIYYRGRIGPVVEEPKDFGLKLEKILNSDLYNYRDELSRFRKNFTFNLGSSSEYAVKAVDELAREI